MLTVGAVLSAVNAVPGPTAPAVFPTLSLAVPAAMLMLSVPLPVILAIRTVGAFVVPLSTLTVPLAVPVLLRVTFPLSRLTLLAPL